MATLQKGGNVLIPHDRVTVTTTWTKAAPDAPGIDASGFVLGASGRVLSDDHFVFYNQNASPDGGVAWRAAVIGADFDIDFTRLPTSVERIIIAATVDGVPKPLSTYSRAEVAVAAGSTSVVQFPVDLSEATEAALILGEFYRRDGKWRFRAVAQGFRGGLAPLARQYGVDVTEESTSPADAVPTPPVVAPPEPPISQAVEGGRPNLSKLDLRKRQVAVILEKRGIGDIQLNIAAIMDRSGSMSGLYARGVVQDTFERVVPVAMRLSPVEKVDTWFFASSFRKTPDCTSGSLEGYVERHAPPHGGLFRRGDGIGFGNNEAPCMRDVIEHFTHRAKNGLPTLVLFFHDGGVTDSAGITRVMKDASALPLFWQFVGLGNGSFGILERLDGMSGRVVDNCNFFRTADITRMSDEQLYEQLLSELPSWLAAARAQGILG